MTYNFIMNENYWKMKWSKDQISAMLLEQYSTFLNQESGIQREKLFEIEKYFQIPHAVIISGLRRVGKSTLLTQIAKKIAEDSFYYLNFEDDRFLGFQAEDFDSLYQLLVEIYGSRKIFILDEVQNISGWEHFVRRFMEMGFKFFITGSNASLLSQELGTRLTGRYIPVELFPFSFKEYLSFFKIPIPDIDRMTTVDHGELKSHLNNYLQEGGIPEALKYSDIPIRQTLYNDVLYRDIAVRYRLEAVKALRELSYTLISNPACPVSYNKLKEQYQLGSVNTVKSYIEYFKNSWLLFSINLFDYSIKRQQIAPKKIYCIDSGLIQSVGFSTSPNTGHLLENIVFLELRRRTEEINYYLTPSGFEVDFYLPKTGELIQVCRDINQPGVRDREQRALIEAIKTLKAKSALILTDLNESPVTVDGTTIEIKSIAEWLLTKK